MLKFNVRYDWSLKRFFCHGCKGLLYPGVNARVRLGPGQDPPGHLRRVRLRKQEENRKARLNIQREGLTQFTPWKKMVRVHDVPADKLIKALAEHLKRVPELEPPQWAPFVKTGSHAERPPQQADWWYTRAASLLRKVYIQGPVGIQKLESAYGGSKALAYFPKHHRDSGGSIIRNILKGMEAGGARDEAGEQGQGPDPEGSRAAGQGQQRHF